MLEGMLLAWGIVNVIGFICFCCVGLNTGGWFDVFVYPSVHKRLWWADIRGASAVIVEVLLTIVLLPLAVAYFAFIVIACILILLYLVIYSGIEAIIHRNDVYDDDEDCDWDM